MIKQILSRFKISNGVRFYNDKSKRRNLLDLKDPEIENVNKVVFKLYPVTKEDVVKEEGEVSRVAMMPKEYIENRIARIYQRSKVVMQQGTDNTKQWILDFGTEERWENPLMGWTASGDSLSNIQLEFPSACFAICFAEKQGWKWVEEKPHKKKEFKKSYDQNFSWNKRTRISTK